MAKTRGKANVAASNVPLKVDAVSGNGNIAESAPSESVETEEVATTTTLDKSEDVSKKEETDDGFDSEEVEGSEENENGGSEEVDGTEENEDGLDESKEVDETEEGKDGLDGSEGADKIEETNDALEKTGEGDEEKTKGEIVELTGPDGPESEKLEERDMTGEVKYIGKAENVSGKKAKMTSKRKKGAHSAAASNDANKSSELDKQKSKEDGKAEPVGTDGPEKKKGAADAAASGDANKSSEADKQGTPAAAKDLKKADGMGLIFMCNAKTKKDCFHYKVFGLPASKKDLVAKIYKGMRLFLYDTDLKLMYGIYKAATAGGYSIEPKAFKSAFPSQVRFAVLNDCLPLPEEKFKSAIKENYSGRNKFDCQLSPEQVKNLCKLFRSASSGKVNRAEQEPTSSSRGRKRPHEREAFRAERERRSPPRGWKRPRREREVARPEQERISSRGWGRSHHERARHDDRIPRDRDMYARREAYASPPRRLMPLPPLQPHVPYSYGQPVDDYYYRRDAPQLAPRDHRIEPLEYRDPYPLYREPVPMEALYREEAVYREPVPYTMPASLPPAAYDPLAMHYRY